VPVENPGFMRGRVWKRPNERVDALQISRRQHSGQGNGGDRPAYKKRDHQGCDGPEQTPRAK
jgi:hypothetical protein